MMNEMMMLVKVIMEWMINTETGLLISLVLAIVVPILGFVKIDEILDEEV